MSTEGRQPWWSKETPKGERVKRMVEVATALDSAPDEGVRQDTNIAHARMFEGGPLSTVRHYGGRYFADTVNRFSISDVSTWNVLRAIVLTAGAIISRNAPRARFTTRGGDYRQKRRARKATAFCDGWAAEHKVSNLMVDALVDAMCGDLGVVELVEDNGRIKPVRVLANEIRVDPYDAVYGSPRTLYRRRFVAKSVVIAAYASGTGREAADRQLAIERAPAVDVTGYESMSMDPMIAVHEAWRLPTSRTSGDGYHVCGIEGDEAGCELFSENWKHPWFPFVFQRWDRARYGFGGVSLAQMLAPMQTNLNIVMDRVGRGLHLMAVPRVWIQGQGKLPPAQVTNAVGSVLRSATRPEVLTWPAMHPEVYAWIQQIIDQMYRLSGISQQASTATKQPGLTSGEAIRESTDLQQGRIQTHVQDWEAAHVELFEKMIEMTADVAGDRKYTVRAPGKRMEEVDFQEIKMDREEYVVSTWPVSQLPLTPQGRKDYVVDMVNSRMWTLEQAKQCMEDLDTESVDSLEVANIRLLEQQFESMLYDGKPASPDEFTPYATAVGLGGKYLALAQYEGCPAKHVDMLRRYLSDLKRLQVLAAPPPVPGAVPGAAPPGAQPAPPPTVI